MLSTVLVGLVLSVALDHMNYAIPEYIRFPISCIIFLMGCFMDLAMKAALDKWHDSDVEVFLDGRNSLSYFDPHALFYILLPPLLFESASGMNWHVLRKVLPSSLILALPGVVVNTALTGLAVKGFIHDGQGYLFTWEASFLLGSILSATDPVAVVAALRSLGAPAKLSSLIEGESLLNDGSAFVVFLVFFDWVGTSAPDEVKLCPGATPGVGCVVANAIQLAAGGSAIGAASGLVVRFWIRRARFLHAPTLELTIILLGVYGSFFLAEAVHCSGVLACVVYGIFMTAIIWPVLSHEARHANHMVLATIGYICDKMIFFLAGMVSMRFIREPSVCGGSAVMGTMVGELIALYLVIHVTRALVVAMFAPALSRLGYGFNWKEGTVLVYGGLRGALALAMGLIVEHNTYIHPGTSSVVAFHTSGIVILTLVINGSTVDNVYKRLCLYPANKYRIRYLKKRLQRIEAECLHTLRSCQKDWFFKDCAFANIFQCVPNFANVEFDERTGRPQATGIVPVSSALQDLEHLANRHMQMSVQTNGPYLDNFDFAWKERHKETTQHITRWLQDAVAVSSRSSGGASDLLENVLDFDNCVLESRCLNDADRTPSSRRVYAAYVSRRSLARVSQDIRFVDLPVDSSNAFFSVKLIELAKERLFVGLTASIPRGTVSASQGLLGRASFSTGIDCSSCRVVHNMVDPEPVQLQTSWEVLCDLLVYSDCSRASRVIGKRSAGQVIRGFQVGAWVQLIGEPGYVAVLQQTGSADDSDAEQPLLGRPGPGEGARTPVSGPGDEAAVGSSSDADTGDSAQTVETAREAPLAGVLTMPHVHLGKPALRPAKELEEKPRALGPGDEVVVRVQRSWGQPWRISFTVHWADSLLEPELVGLLCLGEFPPEELFPVVEFRPLVPSKLWKQGVRDAFARGFNSETPTHRNEVFSSKVKLSFQPEVIDEQESLHEVFITLFNTVSFIYRSMHEEGVIGYHSLRWLLEAADNALDCANRDKHASQITDFKHVEQTQELMDAMTLTVSDGHAISRQRSMSSTRLGVLSQNPFAPIVVEYLGIEETCSQSSWWDRYPRSWKFDESVRSFGYSRTNAKVECLHAFIEAHERVLSELSQLERFTAVRLCVEQVILAAKRDLRLLEELNPRRFFYSKHALVLKICISRRKHFLEEQVREGWIAPSDAEPLIILTRELLEQIETRRPRVVTNWRANSRDLGAKRFQLPAAFRSAWADTFPSENASATRSEANEQPAEAPPVGVDAPPFLAKSWASLEQVAVDAAVAEVVAPDCSKPPVVEEAPPLPPVLSCEPPALQRQTHRPRCVSDAHSAAGSAASRATSAPCSRAGSKASGRIGSKGSGASLRDTACRGNGCFVAGSTAQGGLWGDGCIVGLGKDSKAKKASQLRLPQPENRKPSGLGCFVATATARGGPSGCFVGLPTFSK